GIAGGAALRFTSLLALFLTTITETFAQTPITPKLDLNGDPLPNGAVARMGSPRFHLGDENPYALVDANELQRSRGARELRDMLDLLDVMKGPNACISPDGATLATADEHRTAFIDATNGKIVRSLIAPIQHGRLLQYGPDGSWLLYASPSETVRI